MKTGRRKWRPVLFQKVWLVNTESHPPPNASDCASHTPRLKPVLGAPAFICLDTVYAGRRESRTSVIYCHFN